VQLTERLTIPIWREGRVGAERAALLRDPVMRGRGIPHGDGAPVLLVPGFLAGDISLGLMAKWLKEIGYRPGRARIRANVDCTERALGHLDCQLESLAERHGRRVRVVGQSRGGSMARVLAVRRPDLVEAIVTLGSPLLDEFAIHPLVRNQVRAVALLGSLGVRGLFSYGCRSDCCAQARRDLAAPFPGEVRFTSVYSRSDGIVRWRACLDPAAEHVEVISSHIGMAANAQVYRAIADALPAPATALRAAG
jgi:pimeloyl-ACP methyl ester carboxylesterase